MLYRYVPQFVWSVVVTVTVVDAVVVVAFYVDSIGRGYEREERVPITDTTIF